VHPEGKAVGVGKPTRKTHEEVDMTGSVQARRTISGALFLALASSLLGCEQADAPAEVPEWRLERELTIGSLDDSEEALTHIGSFTVDAEGTMYLGLPRDPVIKVFSAEGEFLRDIGRGGQGPGEFTMIGFLGWLGDTLYVPDAMNQRVSYFGRDGSFLRSDLLAWSVVDEVYVPRTVSRVLADGTYLVQPSFGSRNLADGTVTRRPLFRMNEEGEVLITIARTSTETAQGAISVGSGQMYVSQPFSDDPLLALAKDGRHAVILHRKAAEPGASATMRMEKISVSGDTLWVMDLPYDPMPMRESYRDSVVESFAESLSEGGMLGSAGEARNALEDVFFLPASFPPASRMIVTSDGTIWVKRESTGEDEARWDVFSAEGVPVGRLTLPESSFVFDARDGQVWISEYDELDVPYLARFRIIEG
jgi:hypothetical protein